MDVRTIPGQLLRDHQLTTFDERAIHRGDYQNVLLDEAVLSGAHIMTNAEVTGVQSASDGPQTVLLKDGRSISADVVIGADGTFNL